MMRPIQILVVVAIAATPSCATGRFYGQAGIETSSDEVQGRYELGMNRQHANGIETDLFGYHESDPRNGLEGSGWPRETENGVGARVRYYFSE